ncbi:hypothetical protein NQ314_019881, partial [Rhamnusium bicolor]
MEEIKEAISTSSNSTPVKVMTGDRMAAGDTQEECESNDGSEGGERHRRISAELGSYRGSCTNLKDYDEPLPESLFPTPNEEKPESELDITLTTCSQCHNCYCLLYDEDIMANWSAEDSNLNTLCQSCNKPTVPLLTVSISGKSVKPCDPFSVPYLNPLVLRKELENILAQEGRTLRVPRVITAKRGNGDIGERALSDESSSLMKPVEEGTDPLTQELAAL